MNIKRILFTLIQCTWGFLQTFLGLMVFLFCLRRKHYYFHGAIATEWHRLDGLSLGLFIFIPRNSDLKHKYFVYHHEYGHSIQSLILGPLYLSIIGIPSLFWARLAYFQRKRNRTNRSYYDFFTERSANRLGFNIKNNTL